MSTIQLTLPRIGQVLSADAAGDIQYETELFTINEDITAEDLRSKLRDLNLPLRGKKANLISRLTEYAQNRSQWAKLFQAAPKRKRGQRTAEGKQALSTKRVARMFNEDDSKPTGFRMVSSTPDKRVIKPVTEYQQQQIDEWAVDVLSSSKGYTLNDYVPDEKAATTSMPEELPSEQDANAVPELAGLNDIDSPQSDESPLTKAALRRLMWTMTTMRADVREQINIAFERHASALSLPPRVEGTSQKAHLLPHPAVSTQAFESVRPSTNMVTHQYTASVSGGSVVDTHETGPSMDAQAASGLSVPARREGMHLNNLVTIQLGDQRLTIDRDTVPIPPRRHFSEDLPALFVHWENSDLLQLGTPPQNIPLKYWPKVYQDSVGIMRGEWQHIKAEYANWKRIVEEKNALGSEKAFWEKYSQADGSRDCYQHILTRLLQERKARYAGGANAAKQYFNGDLSDERAQGVFLHRGKDGAMHQYINEKIIAERWRELLIREPRIAAEWQSMQEDVREHA